MSYNQHQVVTFNDGEPLDPTKLNKLSQNIDTLYKRTSVGNQTDGSGNPAVPIIFTLLHKFEEVAPGSVETFPFNFGDKFSADEISTGQVHAVASNRSTLSKGDNITVSVGKITSSPTIYVSNAGKNAKKNVYVSVIAIVLREVTPS